MKTNDKDALKQAIKDIRILKSSYEQNEKPNNIIETRLNDLELELLNQYFDQMNATVEKKKKPKVNKKQKSVEPKNSKPENTDVSLPL